MLVSVAFSESEKQSFLVLLAGVLLNAGGRLGTVSLFPLSGIHIKTKQKQKQSKTKQNKNQKNKNVNKKIPRCNVLRAKSHEKNR